MSALQALQAAIVARLAADPALQALIGTPPAVFDGVPPAARPPYLTLGEGRSEAPFDEGLTAHRIELVVHARQQGMAEADAIASAVAASLHDAALTLAEHRLVSLALIATERRRPRDARGTRVALRFRAVTDIDPA